MSKPNILEDLAARGVLNERIYGGQKNEADDTVQASAAKLDPGAPQSTPGSEALAAASADASPSTTDDEPTEGDPNAAATGDATMPVNFLLISLMATASMAESIEEIAPSVVARYGEKALPVINDVIFKVTSARDMLQELVGGADDGGEEDTSVDDGSGDQSAAPTGPAAGAAPGATATPEV